MYRMSPSQVPEVAMVMLACTRIGAAHSVVFAGFSADALRDRINDARSKWVFTNDEGKRGGRTLPLKKIVDDACVGADTIQNVFYFKRTGAEVPLTPGRDIDMDELAAAQRPYCPCEMMDSEDPLFILYTSGSTGRPTVSVSLFSFLRQSHPFPQHAVSGHVT
jgi:acetyl-CoA synthetase